MNSERLKILILYIFLAAGGLWHFLGVLQEVMLWGASPLMIGLSIFLLREATQQQLAVQSAFPGNENETHFVTVSADERQPLMIWGLIVMSSTFAIEVLGVKTGAIFGAYAYGENLQPLLFEVPLAIGFAWLTMLLCSLALMQRMIPNYEQYPTILLSLLVGVLMVIFDFVMEPAAVKLGYWHWFGDSIPWQNYFAWFLISVALAELGFRMGLFRRKFASIIYHAFFAQIVYFSFVIIK